MSFGSSYRAKAFCIILSIMARVQHETMAYSETPVQPLINRQIALVNTARGSGSIDTFELTCLLWEG